MYLYLHGFGSGPSSKKGTDLRARFASVGHTLHTPDLNAPDFEHLTLTAILARVADVVAPGEPLYLIGSSLGGLSALHFVDRYPQYDVRKMILLAPALDFAANRRIALGEAGMARWQQTGWWEAHNYATGDTRRVHYGLYEDTLKYNSFGVHTDVPTLIIHGSKDESVPVSGSQQFAEGRTNVDLRIVDSDHQLLDQTDFIWQATQTFFAL